MTETTTYTPALICSVEECDSEVWIAGMCSEHYVKWRDFGRADLTDHEVRTREAGIAARKKESVKRAKRREAALRKTGYIPKRERTPFVPGACGTEGCEKPAAARGWCNTCYGRHWRAVGSDGALIPYAKSV